jgi:hypothetical protein
MISLSNSTAQTLASGASLTFDTTNMKTGCAECHRKNTASVKLCARPAIYQVYFSANVSGATADTAVQLNLELSGDILPESTMVATPAATNAVNNVSAMVPVQNNCCDYDRITVTNTGTEAVTVNANALLFIKRIA